MNKQDVKTNPECRATLIWGGTHYGLWWDCDCEKDKRHDCATGAPQEVSDE